MNACPYYYKNTFSLTLVFLFLVFLAACAKENPDTFDCSGQNPTYTQDIKPILNGHCATSGCHDAVTHEQGYDLSNYDDASAASQSNSFLGSVQHKNGFEPMPKNASKLSNDNIQLLTCWVQNGSPE